MHTLKQAPGARSNDFHSDRAQPNLLHAWSMEPDDRQKTLDKRGRRSYPTASMRDSQRPDRWASDRARPTLD